MPNVLRVDSNVVRGEHTTIAGIHVQEVAHWGIPRSSSTLYVTIQIHIPRLPLRKNVYKNLNRGVHLGCNGEVFVCVGLIRLFSVRIRPGLTLAAIAGSASSTITTTIRLP